MDAASTGALDDVYLVARPDGRPGFYALAKLPHVSEKAPQRWVHMAREGLWKGHHSGHEIELTREVFEAFVERFNATANPPAAKRGHPEGDDFAAAGWVLDVEIRDNGLWGLVEFTPSAAKQIAEGEYRYCSIEFALASIDRETGEPAGPVLSGLGLTNVPFIDGLTPITLSRVGNPAHAQQRTLSMAMEPEKVMQQMAKDLGLKGDAAIAAIRKRFDAIAAYMEAIAEKPSEGPPPSLDAVAADPVKASAFGKRAALALAAIDTVKKCAEDLMDTPADAQGEAECAMVCDKLMSLTGLDAPALVAAIEANGDALKALLAVGAASGMPSDAIAAASAASALSAKNAEIKLVMQSNAALGARLSVLESDNAALKAEKAAALKASEDATKEAAIGDLIKFAIEQGHAIESQRAELTDYARACGVEKARAFVLTLAAPPVGAITKDATVASGAKLPPKAEDANADLDVTPRDDAERAVLAKLSASPKKTKAWALAHHRTKNTSA
jgi:hypothetical protein